MTFEEYKNKLLEYLRKEKELTERDIQNHQALSEKEKIEQGYLIKGCLVHSHIDDCYELTVEENNTKLRSGDKVSIYQEGSTEHFDATVVENTFDTISISPRSPLDENATFKIEVVEGFYLDPLIRLLENMENGDSGSFYMSELCKQEKPDETGYGAIDVNTIQLPSRLSESQKNAIEKVLQRPSLYCIQGPPGTGKTDVLALIASIFSNRGKDVLIISNTHQAVNNALNKVAVNHLPVIKIGEALKAQQVSDRILKYKTFNDYRQTSRPRRAQAFGTIVGMTLHSAIINLGLCNSGFLPDIVLVDEASQIPLTMGSAIGCFGASNIIFIGDDRQMPPIFHPELVSDELSKSIFSHLSNQYPDFKTVLDTTYRMNSTICRFVSEMFYEPNGIKLQSHESIADRVIDGESLQEAVSYINVKTDGCKDFNREEAEKAVEQAIKYKDKGYDVAIVTPYRKQVNMVYDQWKAKGRKTEDILVDTVERLQGQDVDVIILTTSVSDMEYYKGNYFFLLDEQRMNVMISRAKRKVIIIKSPIVDFNLISTNNKKNDGPADSNQTVVGQMFYIDGEPDTVAKARKLILESFGDLEFYEEGHRYLLNGKELHSVSTIGHRYLNRPFDADKQAELYASKHGQTAEYWKNQWECNSFKATTLGTKTHEFGESLAYLIAGHPEFITPLIRPQFLESQNYLADIHPKESAVRLFLKDLPSSYHLVLNETKVYSGKNPDETKNLKEQICGTFDMLYWYDGNGDSSKAGFVIFDYKTNNAIQDDYNRQNDIKLLPPFDNMYQEPLGEYTIQLSLYSLMLEDIGLKMIDRKLIWLKDDGTYEKIPVPDISTLLRETL